MSRILPPKTNQLMQFPGCDFCYDAEQHYTYPLKEARDAGVEVLQTSQIGIGEIEYSFYPEIPRNAVLKANVVDLQHLHTLSPGIYGIFYRVKPTLRQPIFVVGRFSGYAKGKVLLGLDYPAGGEFRVDLTHIDCIFKVVSST